MAKARKAAKIRQPAATTKPIAQPHELTADDFDKAQGIAFRVAFKCNELIGLARDELEPDGCGHWMPRSVAKLIAADRVTHPDIDEEACSQLPEKIAALQSTLKAADECLSIVRDRLSPAMLPLVRIGPFAERTAHEVAREFAWTLLVGIQSAIENELVEAWGGAGDILGMDTLADPMAIERDTIEAHIDAVRKRVASHRQIKLRELSKLLSLECEASKAAMEGVSQLTAFKTIAELWPDRLKDAAAINRFIKRHPEVQVERNQQRPKADVGAIAKALIAESRKISEEQIEQVAEGAQIRYEEIRQTKRGQSRE